MIRKLKSIWYNDWKYKIRLNERANPPMDRHMSSENLTGMYLRRIGFVNLFRIRKATTLDLKVKFRSKKCIWW